MSDTSRLHRLDLPTSDNLSEDMRKYFQVCRERLGLVPNVLRSLTFNETKLRNFVNSYNDLMLGDSGLSELEREMIAATVSSLNRCYYCQVAHGHNVRRLAGDPVLGEALVMNYRAAALSPRHRAMLDFAWKVTERSWQIVDADLDELRAAGFSDRDIWDVTQVAAFFNMTNRISSALAMQPNAEYHGAHR